MQKQQVEATSNQQLSARLPLPSVSHVIASSSSQISSNYSYPNSSKPTNSTYFNESPNSNNQTASIAQAVAQRDSSSLQVNPSNYRICSNNIPTSTSATAVFQQFNSPTLLDSSSNISKENLTDEYRELKKLFKHLVYEQECYQSELRNLQRILFKITRDKNFLLDRLLQYETISDSSDGSDSDPSDTDSVKTLEDKPSPKKKIRLSMQRRKMNVGRPRSVFLPNMNDSIVSSSNLNR